MNYKLDTDTQVFFYEQEFYVLSNFSAFAIEFKGILFPTSEHAYHWMKFEKHVQETFHDHPCQLILNARSAHDAYKLGQEYKELRRKDWDEVKVDIMYDIIKAKWHQHEYVRQKLLETKNRILIEDSWRDDFWGWGPNKDGKNVLGLLWEMLRHETLAESPFDIHYKKFEVLQVILKERTGITFRKPLEPNVQLAERPKEWTMIPVSDKLDREVLRSIAAGEHLKTLDNNIDLSTEGVKMVKEINVDDELKRILGAYTDTNSPEFDVNVPLADLGLDSLDVVDLRIAVEEEFNFILPHEEEVKLTTSETTVTTIKDLILKYFNQQA